MPAGLSWWMCSLDVYERLCPDLTQPLFLGLALISDPVLPDDSLSLELAPPNGGQR